MHGIEGSASALMCCLLQRQNTSCACSLRPQTMLNSLMPPSSVTCWQYGTFRFAMAIVTRSLPPPVIGARVTRNQEAKEVTFRPGCLPIMLKVLRILRHHWSLRASNFDVGML